MNTTIAYRLPEHLRYVLKKPLGYLISGNNLIKEIEAFEVVISVGDQVSATLVENNVFPQLMVLDYRTKRRPISSQQRKMLENLENYQKYNIENPPGLLTQQVMEIIRSICDTLKCSDQIQLIVEGEEDLVALPAILYAPMNATIIYGMPYKGVVIVPSTEEYKEKIRSIFSEM